MISSFHILPFVCIKLTLAFCLKAKTGTFKNKEVTSLKEASVFINVGILVLKLKTNVNLMLKKRHSLNYIYFLIGLMFIYILIYFLILFYVQIT